MSSALAIALLTSEVAPFSKTGGLADVTAALAKHLHAGGHDVRLFTPCYGSIAAPQWARSRSPGSLALPLAVGPHPYVFSVLRGCLPGSAAPLYLIDCPRAVRARRHLHHRSGRAPAVPCLHARGIRALPAPGVGPADPALPRLACGFAPLLLRSRVHAGSRCSPRPARCSRSTTSATRASSPPRSRADLDLGEHIYMLHQDDLRRRTHQCRCVTASCTRTRSPR